MESSEWVWEAPLGPHEDLEVGARKVDLRGQSIEVVIM